MSEDVTTRGGVVVDDRPPVSRGWTARYAIASTGMWLAFLTPAQAQLARQAELFDPVGKAALLGLATGVGAAVTAVAVPVFGALSDRTRTRWGRRRPWVAGGIAVAAAGLVALAGAQGAVSLVLGWVLAQVGLSAVQAGLVATIPDRVPRPQLGLVAGWAGMTQMLGALLGTLLVNQVVKDLAPGYLACAAVAVLAVVPFLLGYREPRDLPAPVRTGRRSTIQITPDLAWAWASRFLVTLGFALVTQYLLYYLTDELALADPQRGVLVITAVTVLGAMVSALVTGRWSDRLGRRKVFVAVGGALMGAGALFLALVPAWPVTAVAAGAVGLGFGTFLAVDLAVIATVLPSAADTGRDLGVFAIANAAPQVLAPVLAVPVLAVSGYRGLYLVTAVVAVVGGLLVRRVRSVG
ncbi:MFS transporter [Actinokineospora spheciospongiae]|uniref:MFS transporter n=1 Tax=Actinokineospora spheciospongiae TaxID=909613 RepID=UPI0009FC4A25|nr:MFS transporter [Actinokineospora spheciospongiae]